MDRLKQRPSLAKLADRFNTAPPPGYVAGRGRGVSGFSKPDPADLPKGRGARGAGAAGAGSSSAELQATLRPQGTSTSSSSEPTASSRVMQATLASSI